MKEDEMQIITQVAKATGVSASTLRWWARIGRLSPAERRENERGVLSWYTTIQAVQAVLNTPQKEGRRVQLRR